MSDCQPCDAASAMEAAAQQCTTMTCDQRMCMAVNAYHSLMMGQQVVEAQFGTERVRYTAANADQLKNYISMLHASCPSPDSAAILGLVGGGPLGVSFGCGPRRRCGC